MVDISVVIPTHNRDSGTVKTITALMQQRTTHHFEVIVIDDGSTDSTKAVIESLTDVVGNAFKLLYYYQQNSGPAAARNLGIIKSQGRFVAFLDSDCIPKPNWLSEICAQFKNTTVAAVGGNTLNSNRTLIDQYIDAKGILNPVVKNGIVIQIVTANACFRKDLLERAGNFDESFKFAAGEDTEISLRLRNKGYNLEINNSAEVLHEHTYTLASFISTMVRYGIGRYQVTNSWPEKIIRNPLKLLIKSAIAIFIPSKFSCKTRKRISAYESYILNIYDKIADTTFLFGYMKGKYLYLK